MLGSSVGNLWVDEYIGRVSLGKREFGSYSFQTGKAKKFDTGKNP